MRVRRVRRAHVASMELATKGRIGRIVKPVEDFITELILFAQAIQIVAALELLELVLKVYRAFLQMGEITPLPFWLMLVYPTLQLIALLLVAN
jgi:hypothetical protein